LAERFHEALQRYKSAIEAAPDQADTYLRQGFALIAVNQYRLAAKAFKIALQLNPNLIRNEFRLDDMYGVNQLAKAAHLEAVSREALDNPADGDLLLLVGLTLQADGEPARAQRFLLKAAELGGDEVANLLAPLIGAAPPAAKVPAVEAKADRDI
jgi:tetratricopeptide (TPR) repeat protein